MHYCKPSYIRDHFIFAMIIVSRTQNAANLSIHVLHIGIGVETGLSRI